MNKIVLSLLVFLIPAISFAQGLPLKDGNSSSLADVESCGAADKCVRTAGPQTPPGAGLEALVGTTGASASDATGGRMNRAYVSEGSALKIAGAQIIWDDTFNATAQNTSKYTVSFTTQTLTMGSGFLNINAAAGVAINTNSGIQTFRTFPLFAKSESRVNFSLQLTQVPQTNNLIEFGLFSAVLSTRVAPLDGVFFRYNAAAELRGVINYNGVETQTAPITAPSANVTHDFTIVTQTNTVNFYIDDVRVGTITLLTDATALGQPFMMGTQPITMRTYIGGTGPGAGTIIKVTDVFVTILGPDADRSWGEMKSGMGHAAYQGQNGGTMGTTALYANSSNPAATVPTNTTAALGSGFGGKFQETLTLVAGTDGIISSYQNPAGSVTQTPRNLVVRGVCVSGVVSVVLSVAPLSGTMSLAYGHTAVSLATAESASFTNATTKAPRRVPLFSTGLNSATAAVGTPVTTGVACMRFDGAPVVVNPGEFIAVTHNKVSAAPTTGAVMWTISFDGYFE